jgi:hypothetical protein
MLLIKKLILFKTLLFLKKEFQLKLISIGSKQRWAALALNNLNKELIIKKH